MEVVNLDKLYDIYIEHNNELNVRKLSVLEGFREKENNFKKYEDIVSLLEKEKNESKIDSYASLSEEVLRDLKNFNPNSIEENLRPVKNQILNIRTVKEDISKVSDKFRYIENMWLSFLERKSTMDPSAVFIKDIFIKIANIKKEFSYISINDLGMIEEKIDTLKTSIMKAMSIIEDFTAIIDRNVFIGKEPKMLFDKIKSFIDTDYKKMSLTDINVFALEIEEEIERLQQYRIRKTVRAKVIKLKSKQNQSIYNYGIELNGIMMYVSEKLSTNEIKEDTRKFLYIDNFPIYGLFDISKLNEEIEVSDNQFFANKELNDISLNLFLLNSFITIFILGQSIWSDYSPIVTIPLAILMQFVFAFFFKGLMYRINDKFNLKNMFYFFKISFIYVSIGDDGLDVQKVVPNILLNFDNIIDNDFSIERKEDKQESKDIEEVEEEPKEENKDNKKTKKQLSQNIKTKFLKIIDDINKKDAAKKLKKKEETKVSKKERKNFLSKLKKKIDKEEIKND